MYNTTGVEALEEVRRVVEALGPPILFRKLHAVFNAIEVHIEDGKYRIEAIVRLGEALQETAVFYGVNPAVQNQLAQAFKAFVGKLQPAR